jgi:hypothetical protein
MATPSGRRPVPRRLERPVPALVDPVEPLPYLIDLTFEVVDLAGRATGLDRGALDPLRQENPHADKGDEGKPCDEQRDDPGHLVARGACRDQYSLLVDALD